MGTSPQSGITRRRAHARVSALERARSRASELANVLAAARSSALAFEHVEVLDDERVLDRTSAIALAITPGSTLDLGRARSRASDLAHVLDRAYNQARYWEGLTSHVRNLSRDVTAELVATRTRLGGRTGALTLDLARTHALYDDDACASALIYERARAERTGRDLPHARDLTRDLARARALTRDLVVYVTRAATQQHAAGQIAPLADHLLSAASRLLPVGDRARYAEEFWSELSEIACAGTRHRAQLAYASHAVISAWRLRAELRASRAPKEAP